MQTGSIIWTRVCYGTRLYYKLASGYISRYLSVTLAYTFVTPKYKYPKNGKEVESTTDLQAISLPVAIGFSKKISSVGYYGQAGVTFNYTNKVTPDYKALVWNYHKLWVDPSLNFGYFQDVAYRWLNGSDSNPVRLSMGVYVGYAINNLSAEQNVSLSLMQVGLKYTMSGF